MSLSLIHARHLEHFAIYEGESDECQLFFRVKAIKLLQYHFIKSRRVSS
jgi:hypothetical protein